jgi:DNA polymerase V
MRPGGCKMVGKPLAFYLPDLKSELALPAFLSSVPAGFPSPAEDFMETRLDLNKHIIKNQAATFFVRATGDSMIGAGIHDGDLLVVDRSLRATEKKVIVAVVNGEFTVKRLRKSGARMFLVSENANYKPIVIWEGMDFQVWGVVTHVVHKV